MHVSESTHPSPVHRAASVALDGSGHASRTGQASMIRASVMWRSNHACDERLRRIADRADMA